MGLIKTIAFVFFVIFLFFSFQANAKELPRIDTKFYLGIYKSFDKFSAIALSSLFPSSPYYTETDAEKRNADDSNIAYLNRVLGAVDLSPYAIFNEYDDKGSLNHISMKTIKRQTDELVSTISMWLHYGMKKYIDGGNSNLNALYKECDESKTKDY